MARPKVVKPAFEIDGIVTFLGYKEDVPDDQRLLEEGENYTVVEVNDDDKFVVVEIENPDFNPKKKETDKNHKTLGVEVFFD